ncbi:hypothetical protein [Endozoicomonas sp. 4G]|uniref:hypothetical protein n=1 Tax=Endozoicomonas sp. 4G TaxID=2872754 RepID=UPI0020789A5E|nr:hypothetical protein [Endozoicomonas sp. 4G]
MNDEKVQKSVQFMHCADCGREIELNKRPCEDWQLEDGRTVCPECCIADMQAIVERAREEVGQPRTKH